MVEFVANSSQNVSFSFAFNSKFICTLFYTPTGTELFFCAFFPVNYKAIIYIP